MTNQEKKDYLMQYRYVEAEERRLEEELERWRSRAEKTTSGYSLAPSGGGDGRSLEHAVEHIDELIRELEQKRDELAELRQSIGAAIDAVPKARHRQLFRLRYIDGLRWEDIAEKMGYDISWVTRLHGMALEQLALENTS